MMLRKVTSMLRLPFEFWSWRRTALAEMERFSPGPDDKTILASVHFITENGIRSTEAFRPLVDLLVITDWLEDNRAEYLVLGKELQDKAKGYENGEISKLEIGIEFWRFTVFTMWLLSGSTRAVRKAARVKHSAVDSALLNHSRSTVIFQEQFFEALQGIVRPEGMFEAARWHVARSVDVVSRDYRIAYGLRIDPSEKCIISQPDPHRPRLAEESEGAFGGHVTSKQVPPELR